MAIRIYKPTSAGRRNASVNEHSAVTKKKPEKALLRPLPKKGGRNHHGKITVRGRGGGAKRRYRVIDFKRHDRDGIAATVIGIEYDPNRTCNIALLEYADGVRRYIPAPVGLTDGQVVEGCGTARIEPQPGNNMRLADIPTGLNVHCIELQPGKGGQMCRSAGMFARLTNKEGSYATLVLPSGEQRRVSIECRATIGQIGNPEHQGRRIGKAGINRHKGRRPITRGVARNHNDHPLGGGDGRKGNRSPCSPTGVDAKGGSTRNRKQHSSKLILRRRTSKRYGQRK